MEDYKWVDINEYSRIKNISVSSIRRYIKANRVKWKKTDGKYLIRISESLVSHCEDRETELERELLRYKLENQELHARLMTMAEQCAEMKMLIELYEQGKELRIESR